MSNRQPSSDIWELFNIPSIEAGGVDAYLQTILVRCAGWFGAKAASVFVISNDGLYRCRASIGTIISPEATITEGLGIAGSALRHGQAMLVQNPSDNPILADQVQQRRNDIGSAMVIPLISNGRKLGVLNVARSESGTTFNEEDLAKANTLASNLSLAVANWQMLGEIKSASDQITTVFNLLDAAIVTLKNNKITQKNQGADKLLEGETYQDVLFNLPRAFSDAVNEVVALAEGGESAQAQRVHDSLTWIMKASPLPDGGVLLVVEDVTKAVEVTSELSRVRRLAEIGQMTAAIAHEIRNPLTGIRSAAQMISHAPDQAEELAKMIEEEAVKLNDLCTQFLDFARPVEPVVSRFDLESLASRLAAVHANEFSECGVELHVQGDHHHLVEADKNQVEQVMRNLMINALHATSAGGVVTINVFDGGFEVIDTGYGMDEDTVKSLFMPFFTTKPKGTGLGLSNCRKIIEAHGGTIEVESQPGQGSRFRVQLAEYLKRAA